MMTLIFAFLTLALVFAWIGRERTAFLCIAITLAFSIGLFLFEVYSPQYGFGMPWISVSLSHVQGEG